MLKRLEGRICPKNVSDALHYDTRRWRVLDGEPSGGLDLFAKQSVAKYGFIPTTPLGTQAVVCSIHLRSEAGHSGERCKYDSFLKGNKVY